MVGLDTAVQVALVTALAGFIGALLGAAAAVVGPWVVNTTRFRTPGYPPLSWAGPLWGSRVEPSCTAPHVSTWTDASQDPFPDGSKSVTLKA